MSRFRVRAERTALRYPAAPLVVLLAGLLVVLVAGCDRPAPSNAPARPAASAPGTGSASPTPVPSPAPYFATVEVLPPAIIAQMTGVSWRPGCPLALDRLRLIRLTYWGFDGTVHTGELIVHTDIAPAVFRVFGKLYDARFPIRKMQRVEAYGGDDIASMADDNTSGFNCRRVEGSTSWSWHAYGKAIDINTVENPYIRGGNIQPPAGASYLDRSNVRPGMIVDGDVVTRAFAAEGFRWGGQYRTLKDYQHFEMLR